MCFTLGLLDLVPHKRLKHTHTAATTVLWRKDLLSFSKHKIDKLYVLSQHSLFLHQDAPSEGASTVFVSNQEMPGLSVLQQQLFYEV